MTKSEANPSIKVNNGVLLLNVQSQGFKSTRCVQVEGVEFVVNAFKTHTKIVKMTRFCINPMNEATHRNRECRNPSLKEDKLK